MNFPFLRIQFHGFPLALRKFCFLSAIFLAAATLAISCGNPVGTQRLKEENLNVPEILLKAHDNKRNNVSLIDVKNSFTECRQSFVISNYRNSRVLHLLRIRNKFSSQAH